MASHAPPLPSPPPSLSKPPRRVPPPCWTHEETLALIESYHEKWYSLRRGNLKASHWQEVADAVARRCRFVTPSKTSVQCRHKIEKLRKRYRTEKQRAANASASGAPNRFSSSWNFFKKMDDMERGPLAAEPIESDEDEDDDDEDNDDDDDEHDPIVNNAHQINYNRMITNGSGGGGGGGGSGGGGAFRFRIPGGSRSVPSPMSASPLNSAGSVRPNLNNYGRFDEVPRFKPNHNSNTSPNPRFFNSPEPRSGSGRGDGVRSGAKRETDPVADMVSSIRMLGEGFVRMEQKKIEMAKEMEQMRMDMEMKRTQMILESQQRIVEAFASGMSGKKKMKRMPSPDC